VPAQQLPHPLGRVTDVEQAADQRLDPAQSLAPVTGEPVRQRPLPQFQLQPRPLLRAQLSRDTGPLDLRARSRRPAVADATAAPSPR
jgi:hypothetical protein